MTLPCPAVCLSWPSGPIHLRRPDNQENATACESVESSGYRLRPRHRVRTPVLVGSDSRSLSCLMASHDGQRRPGGQTKEETYTVVPQRAAYRPAPTENPIVMLSSLIA